MSSIYDESVDPRDFLLFIALFIFGYLVIFSLFIPIAIATGNAPEWSIVLPVFMLPLYFYIRSKDDYK